MNLFCNDTGQGPVLLLLHGFPFENRMWEAQVEALKSAYRVVTPDLRGHGRSAAPDASVYPIDTMADDVAETLGRLGIAGPVVVAGLSMGGYVALALAARHPELLRALILMDTRAGADSPEAAAARGVLAAKVEAEQNVEPVVQAQMPKLFSPLTAQRQPQLLELVEAMMRQTSPNSVAATLRGLGTRPDRSELLPTIEVPALVVVGESDALTPPDEARKMAAALPHATLVVVPESGHMAPMENPGVVNQAIRSFLETLDRSVTPA